MEDKNSCPLPARENADVISLAHGEGGGLTRRLIRERIHSQLGNAILDRLSDAAIVPHEGSSFAMTTDTFVVDPLFFPGGDIGSLAVYGTVNDLLVSGAVPKYLSLSFVIEEGLSFEIFDQILHSIRRAAQECGVMIVTGDTKVVARGDCDQIFINTTGIGFTRNLIPPGPEAIVPGDVIIVTDSIAQHGIAILACRQNLELTPQPLSDSKCVSKELEVLLPYMSHVRAIRDATRGGVGAVLQEWAEASGCTLSFDTTKLPLNQEVRAVSELLGLDPMHIACEGTLVIAVEADAAPSILTSLHNSACNQARVIGSVRERDLVPVTCINLLGQELPFQEPMGAPLPRIC